MKAYFRQRLPKRLYHNAYSRAWFTHAGIALQEFRCAFPQFFTWRFPLRSFFRVVAVLASALARLFLGRSVRYSFAFTGEDRLISGLLLPKIYEKRFYVEVGCNHPVFLSNTYALYRVGWRGICIDANAELIAKYSLYRPKDVSITALVSNQVKDMTFHQIENDVLSTVDEANVRQARQEGLSVTSKSCQSTTLTLLLDQHGAPKYFDLLSIDAEEHDYAVLTSLDFSKYCPKLVVVEDESFDMLDAVNNRFVKFLATHHYQLAGSVLKNLYFMYEKPEK